jgi:hypothetical protein
MSSEKRDRVTEWRLTRKFFPADGSAREITARFWIESDESYPYFGGISRSTARERVLSACERVEKAGMFDPLPMATTLLEMVPDANSVEVCDDTGTGVAIHRDWP